jgi:hypothetical protein
MICGERFISFRWDFSKEPGSEWQAPKSFGSAQFHGRNGAVNASRKDRKGRKVLM